MNCSRQKKSSGTVYSYGRSGRVFYDRSFRKLALNVEPVLDEAGLEFYLNNGYFPPAHMVFRGVKKIIPDMGYPTQILRENRSVTEDTAAIGLNNRLLEAFSGFSSQKAVVLFTGGLDGAIVAAFLKSMRRTVVTACGGFYGYDSSLFRDAEQSASILGFKHNNIEVTFREAQSSWPLVIKSEDEPVFDLDTCTAYSLFIAARDLGEAFYSGMGCDSVFSLKRNRAYWRNFREKSLVEISAHENIINKACGMSIHFPYLNSGFADYVYSLPARFKIKGGIDKYILRRISSGLLPQTIVHKMSNSVSFPTSWIKALAVSYSADIRSCAPLYRYYSKIRIGGIRKDMLVLKLAYLALWLKGLR